jgi:DNA polymerase-1
MIVTLDIETDGLSPTKVWCVVTKELHGAIKVWSDYLVWNNWEGGKDAFNSYIKDATCVIAHNGLAFDIPVLNRLYDSGIQSSVVCDTFVVSRLVNYSGLPTHSLDDLGQALNYPKGSHTDWSRVSREMIDYCVKDVELTEKVYLFYKPYLDNPEWKDSIDVEHGIQLVCNDMQNNGFKFDKEKAEEYLAQIKEQMEILEVTFQEIWPPELTEVHRILYRIKKDGSFFKTTEDAMRNYPRTVVDGEELVCFDYKIFNPGSTKDRIEKLWAAGWEPVEKTKTHLEFERKAKVGEYWRKSLLTYALWEEKKEHFDYYGWVVSEENLSTLPSDAPEGAKTLAKWLTLEGRRSSLQEWIGCVSEDGRIHGKFWHIGAWTGRMSHSNPNQANISSPFHGEPKSPIEEVKAEFDGKLRALWTVDEGHYLVGTDAEGIQLRILAHLMQSKEYVTAITSGKKEDETDIHNLNKRSLGPICRDRDTAKTFIYAFLLGAGTEKVSRILDCTKPMAKGAVQNFLDSLPELKRLKAGRIPRDAARGFFRGLDGRKVVQSSEYLMLAGYLQNGEAVVMKHANLLWRKWATEAGVWFKQVDFVHDEWQTEVSSKEDAIKLGELQCKAIEETGKRLNLFCPLQGNYKVGTNWLETH